jgi:hypothetical protein
MAKFLNSLSIYASTNNVRAANKRWRDKVLPNGCGGSTQTSERAKGNKMC